MATQVDVVVPYESWLDLNTETGISTGVELIIQNKGTENILVFESATQPASDFYEGAVVYTLPDFPSTCEVDINSERIWVRSTSDKYTGLLNVQGVE